MKNRFSQLLRMSAALTLVGACAFPQTRDLPPSAPLKIPALAFEKYKLENGLEVILHEDHRLPLVAVDIWYHVGPVNEVAGRTGFAHLFEHMMFEGSEHVGEKAHFNYLEGAGATDINGTTDFDRTNYFATLPSNQLELALWLESDRMGFLLPTLDRAKLTNQRDVVRNERRQGEGTPYSLGEEEIFHLLFSKEHPYYASVIGSHADIEAARLNDVRSFFQHYYTPNNATVAIAGDFNPATLKVLLEKYFGPIPAGPPVPKVNVVTPPITAEKRATVTDAVQLPRVSVAWLTPPFFQPGDAEADLLMEVLGGGKSSRLYRTLVYRDQIAQSVDCGNMSLRLASVATCNVTARPGVKPSELEAAVNKTIEELRKDGPTQGELDRARNMHLSRMIEQLQRLGGFGGVADMMNQYNQYVGDPGFLPKDAARYQNATVESVRAVARQSFAQTQRVTVYTVSGKKVLNDVPRSPENTDADVKVENTLSAEIEAREAWRKTSPLGGASSELRLPVPKVFSLANGMQVYLVEDHALPVVSAEVVTLAGNDANPEGRPGLAGFVARMLTEGTAHRSATQLASDSDQIGATLTSSARLDNGTAMVSALSNNTDAALDLLADVTQHPAFQAQEVERVRQERVTQILQEADNPFQSLQRVGAKVLYGETPYGYPSSGTTASTKAITREDLLSFWNARYGPRNAALILVGDVQESEARRVAAKYFETWTGSDKVSTPSIPIPPPAPTRRVIIVDQPNAPQTALGAFGLGLARTTSDYAAVNVMNGILGGLFSSRINMNLREKNGFTYGAFSFFEFARGAGPFLAGSMVRTDVTAPAAKELLAEITRIQVDPATPVELKLAKENALQSLPGGFETVNETARFMADLFTYKLPPDYYRTLPADYKAVTPEAVIKAAQTDVHPGNVVLVAVGDRAKIESALAKMDLGPIEIRNASGDLVK